MYSLIGVHSSVSFHCVSSSSLSLSYCSQVRLESIKLQNKIAKLEGLIKQKVKIQKVQTVHTSAMTIYSRSN